MLHGRSEDGRRSDPDGHEIPPLADPHLEADDADARPPGARRRALALPEGEPAGGQGLARIHALRCRRPTAPFPTLHIEAGPRIQINPIGADISQSKLRRYVPVFEEHAVDHDLLVEGAHNLRDYLQSQGYFEAEVRVQGAGRHQRQGRPSTYLINTGKRHKLVEIKIDGNHYFTTEAIRERMFLQTGHLSAVPARPVQREPAAAGPRNPSRTSTSRTASAT